MTAEFEMFQTHPRAGTFDQLAPPPKPGDQIQKFIVGRIKCVPTLHVILTLLRGKVAKHIRIIPHPATIRACWIIEIKAEKNP